MVRLSDSLQDLIRYAFAPLHLEHFALVPATKSAKTYARTENLAAAPIPPDAKLQLHSEILGWTFQIVEL